MHMMDVGPFELHMFDQTVYTYPLSAKIMGWVLGFSSVLMVPFIAIKTIMSYKGTFCQVNMRFDKKWWNYLMMKRIFQRLLLSITPEKEQKDILEGKPGSRTSTSHWLSL